MNKGVLYVDDEQDLLELAKSFFEDEGLELDTCTNIQDAISLVKTNSYRVIITDAQMPGGSGGDLIRFLRSELSFQGIIILATGSLQKNLENSGYDIVINKPIDFDQLIDQVKEYLS